ncbi:MAG: SdrD B-like domain-containing protein, partial [Patescibacteria group bacterium]
MFSYNRKFIGRISLSTLILLLSGFSIFILFYLFNNSIARANPPTLAINLVVEETGKSPFDTGTCGPAPSAGDDYCATDDYVRNDDTVVFRWDISVNDSDAQDLTVTHEFDYIPGAEGDGTLPLRWNSLPSACTGSVLVSNKTDRKIVCNLGDLPAGTNISVPVSAKVSGELANNTNISTNASVTSNLTSDIQSNSISVINSVRPEMDLQALSSSSNQSIGENINNENGYFINAVYDINKNRLQGNEPLDLSGSGISFPVELDFVSGNPNNAILNGNCDFLFNATGPIDLNCTQTSAGEDIIVTLKEVVGDNLDYDGLDNPAPITIPIWLPFSDVSTSEQLKVEAVNFDPDSVSGVSNYLSSTEPTFNNDLFFNLDAVQNYDGVFSKYHTGMYKQSNDSVVRDEPFDDFYLYPQAGYGYQNSEYRSHVKFSHTSFQPVTNLYLCDNFDNLNSNIITGGAKNYGDSSKRYNFLNTDQSVGLLVYSEEDFSLPSNFSYTVEYGVGSWSTQELQRTTTCEDSSNTWYSDINTVPGGVSAINQVRLRIPNVPATTGVEVQYMMNFGLRITTGNDGTKVKNYGLGYADQIENQEWAVSPIDLENQDFGYVLAGRVDVEGQASRPLIIKEFDNSSGFGRWIGHRASADTEMKYKIEFNVERFVQDNPTTTVTITDVLPKHLTYIENTSRVVVDGGNETTIQPTSVVVNPTTQQTNITWEIPNVSYNSGIESNYLLYDTYISGLTPNETELENLAEINITEGFEQYGSSCFNYGSCSLTRYIVENTGSFNIQKSTSDSTINTGESVSYTIAYANQTSNPIGDTDIIDVLPYDSDFRGSNFDGTITLTGVTLNQTSNQTLFVTKADPSTIPPDPCDPKNIENGNTSPVCNSITGTGDIVWCTGYTGGNCPNNIGEVTAIRVKHTNLPDAGSGDPIGSFSLSYNTQGNNLNNIYYNTTTGRIDSNTLSVLSNTSTVEIPSGSISGRLWIDSNQNNQFDSGEELLSSVVVELYDTNNNLITQTNTDSQGNYSFSDLASDTYVVKSKATQDPSYDFDGVATPNIVNISVDTSNSVKDRINIDFGYNQNKGSISGKIHTDSNFNNQYDNGETELESIPIELVDDQNNVVAQTTTDANGNYQFSDIPEGIYTIRTIVDEIPVYDPDGVSSPKEASIEISADPNKTLDHSNINFGYSPRGSISGTVYEDLDYNFDFFDAFDGGSDYELNSSPSVSIFDSNNQKIGDGDGEYSFGSLLLGTYTLRINPNSSYYQLEDPDSTRNLETTIEVTSQSLNVTEVDFGFAFNSQVSGSTFLDINQDGVCGNTTDCIRLSEVEYRLTGINILNESVDRVVNSFTSSNTIGSFQEGDFYFGEVKAGNYTLTQTQPSEYDDGLDYLGSNDGFDSSKEYGTLVPPNSITFDIGANGDRYYNTKFTEQEKPQGSISGRLYRDNNLDFDRQITENGFTTWSVNLLDSSNNIIATDTLD